MKQMKVLVVHDKEILREALARLLQERDPSKDICHCSSKQAAAKAEQTKPNLVLMDADLSDRDVIEVIPQIRRSCPKAGVAMLTGSADKEKLLSWVDAGAKGFLAEDQSVDEFVKSIDLIARGRMVASSVLAEKFFEEFTKLRKEEGLSKTEGQPVISEREGEVLRLIARGHTNKEIAQKLFIAANTAKVHVSNILAKLELRNRQQAAAYAAEHRLTSEGGGAQEKD